MRTAAFVVLFGALLSAQKAPKVDVPLNAEWVGPLRFEDTYGEHIGPTSLTLKIAGRAIQGTWIGLNASPPSGSFTGTIDDKGQWHIAVEFSGNAQHYDVNNEPTEIQLERCTAKGEFVGTLFPSMVLRWTAKRIAFDTAITRAKSRSCDDMRNVTWILQLRH